jgi:O-antigen ligase
MFACLAGFGAYLALTAVAEVNQLYWAVFPKYIASPEYEEFFGRARGPFLNPIANGFLLGACLIGALSLWPRANRAGRAGLLLLASLICLGVYYTLTRSVWLGAGAGLLVYLGLTLPRAWRAPILAGSLILATVVGMTQWERLLAFKRDQALSARDVAESVKLRPVLAIVAWNMFLDRPLVGCGFGHYQSESVNYLADRSTTLPLEKARPFRQHNVFLSVLTETGLIGAGLFILLLLLWTRDAWLTWKSPRTPAGVRPLAVIFLALLANYAVNGMFHDMSVIAMVNMVLFCMAGVASGLRPRAEVTTVGR